MNSNKEGGIAYKVDATLPSAKKGVTNRSEFIRLAVQSALAGTYPPCKGSGVLNPNKKKHWAAFAASHFFEECGECHESRLVCARKRVKRTNRQEAGSPGE